MIRPGHSCTHKAQSYDADKYQPGGGGGSNASREQYLRAQLPLLHIFLESINIATAESLLEV